MDPNELIRQAEAAGVVFSITPQGKMRVAPPRGLDPTLGKQLHDNADALKDVVLNNPKYTDPRYQANFARPATQTMARLLSGLAHGGRVGTLYGDPRKQLKQQPSRLAQWTAEQAVPQTSRQAGRDVGTVLGSLVPGGIASRTAGTALGGYAGAKLSGEGWEEAAGSIPGSLGQSALGETVGWGLGQYGQKTLNKMMTKRVGQMLTEEVPALAKDINLTDPLAFDQAFRSGAGLKKVGGFLSKVEDNVASLLRGRKLHIPAGAELDAASGKPVVDIPFREAVERYRALDKKSQWNQMDPSNIRQQAEEARVLAHQVRDQLHDELEKTHTGRGDAWQKANRQYGITKTFSDLFADENFFQPKGGGIDWNKVTPAVSQAGSGFRRKLESAGALGIPGTEKLLKTLAWGERTTALDVPGQFRPHARVGLGHFGFYPGGRLPSRLPNIPRRFPPGLPVVAGGQAVSNLFTGAGVPSNVAPRPGAAPTPTAMPTPSAPAAVPAAAGGPRAAAGPGLMSRLLGEGTAEAAEFPGMATTAPPAGLPMRPSLRVPLMRTRRDMTALTPDFGVSRNTLEIPGGRYRPGATAGAFAESEGPTLEIPQAGGPTGRVATAAAPDFGPASPPSIRSQGRIPKSVISQIISQESGFRPEARGKAGEIGLMQVMPSTAKQYGVSPEQLANPMVNQAVGTRYLGDLMKRYHGDLHTALMAYNAGPTRVDSGKIPHSAVEYADKIMGYASLNQASPTTGGGDGV